jgi:hypothetical protein
MSIGCIVSFGARSGTLGHWVVLTQFTSPISERRLRLQEAKMVYPENLDKTTN